MRNCKSSFCFKTKVNFYQGKALCTFWLPYEQLDACICPWERDRQKKGQKERERKRKKEQRENDEEKGEVIVKELDKKGGKEKVGKYVERTKHTKNTVMERV